MFDRTSGLFGVLGGFQQLCAHVRALTVIPRPCLPVPGVVRLSRVMRTSGRRASPGAAVGRHLPSQGTKGLLSEGGRLQVDLEVFPSSRPEVTGALVHQQPVPVRGGWPTPRKPRKTTPSVRTASRIADGQTDPRRPDGWHRGAAGGPVAVPGSMSVLDWKSPLSYPDCESSCSLFRISDRVFGRDDALLNLKSSEKGGLDLGIPAFVSPSRRGSVGDI